MLAPHSSTRPRTRRRRKQRPRVLAIDDDPHVLRAIEGALAGEQYVVETIANYEGAVEAIHRKAPPFAVIDLMLGEHSGLDLLTMIREKNPKARCVILTGYSSVATAMEAVRLGASDYLFKPVNTEKLRLALERGAPSKKSSSARAWSLARMEWEYITRVLTDCQGNISEAAKALGIPRRSLQRKLKKYAPRE